MHLIRLQARKEGWEILGQSGFKTEFRKDLLRVTTCVYPTSFVVYVEVMGQNVPIFEYELEAEVPVEAAPTEFEFAMDIAGHFKQWEGSANVEVRRHG